MPGSPGRCFVREPSRPAASACRDSRPEQDQPGPGGISRPRPSPAARCSGSRGGRWRCRSLGHPGRRSVALAVVRRAQERAALHHLAGDRRACGVEAAGRGGPCGRRPRSTRLRLAVVLVPVGRPLPDVAGHVEQAVAVRAGTSRPGAVPSKPSRRRFSLGNSPCHVLATWRPPGASSSPQANSAPSRPPRAARSHSASVGSALPAQRGVRLDVGPGDVHDGVLRPAPDRAGRARRDGASRRRARSAHQWYVVAQVDASAGAPEDRPRPGRPARDRARVVGRIGGSSATVTWPVAARSGGTGRS